MGRSADDDRHLAKPSQLGRAKTFRAKEDPVATIAGRAANDDRLKDSVRPDVGREFRQIAFRKLSPRIPWILFEKLDRSQQRFTRRNGLGVEEVSLVRSKDGAQVGLWWCPRHAHGSPLCWWLTETDAGTGSTRWIDAFPHDRSTATPRLDCGRHRQNGVRSTRTVCHARLERGDGFRLMAVAQPTR